MNDNCLIILLTYIILYFSKNIKIEDLWVERKKFTKRKEK